MQTPSKFPHHKLLHTKGLSKHHNMNRAFQMLDIALVIWEAWEWICRNSRFQWNCVLNNLSTAKMYFLRFWSNQVGLAFKEKFIYIIWTKQRCIWLQSKMYFLGSWANHLRRWAKWSTRGKQEPTQQICLQNNSWLPFRIKTCFSSFSAKSKKSSTALSLDSTTGKRRKVSQSNSVSSVQKHVKQTMCLHLHVWNCVYRSQYVSPSYLSLCFPCMFAVLCNLLCTFRTGSPLVFLLSIGVCVYIFLVFYFVFHFAYFEWGSL